MTELLKQRVVGLLLVIVAGVVFIPDILDGQKQRVKEEFQKIPVRPVFDGKPIVSDFSADKAKTAVQQAQVMPKIVVSDNELKPTSQPTPQDTVEPEQTFGDAETTQVAVKLQAEEKNLTIQNSFDNPAWVLRLGSFRHKDNVDALVTTLRDAGLSPLVKPVEVKAGLLYRVFVGPEIDKQRLIEAQLKTKELVNLEGKITLYDPKQ